MLRNEFDSTIIKQFERQGLLRFETESKFTVQSTKMFCKFEVFFVGNYWFTIIQFSHTFTFGVFKEIPILINDLFSYVRQ